MKKIWPFSFYFLILAGAASYRPYLVLYYQSLSFTGAQIGLLAGIAPLITLFSLPLVTGLADRTNRHRLIMSLSLLVMVSGLLLPLPQDLYPLIWHGYSEQNFFLANHASFGQRHDVHAGG